MALTDNLVAYWKLDESSGNATDSSGNSRTLTNNGSTPYAAALINNGVDFGTTNTGKYFTRGDASGMVGSAFTVSTWVKGRTELSTNESTLFTTIRTTSPGFLDINLYYQDVSGTKSIRYGRERPGVDSAGINYNTTLGTSDWHHVVMTYDGTNLIGYYDGNDVTGNYPLSGYGTGGADATRIGGYSWGYARMYVDETGFWSRALSSSEVTELYNSGAGLTYPFTGGGGSPTSPLMMMGVGV